MATIYETENFYLESHERPEISREEGGHVKISPKVEISDRTKLLPKQAIEFVRFSVVCGRAMKTAMGKRGVEIGRINYQENGNWNKHFHLHLYCRAVDAKMQKFGDPIKPGHRDEYEPLNGDDIAEIRIEIERLFALAEFSDEQWGL